jgi:hypothetical protein
MLVGCESFTESPWPEIYVPEIKDVSVQTERKERVQQQAVQQPAQPEEEEEEEEEVTQVKKNTLTVHPQYYWYGIFWLLICGNSFWTGANTGWVVVTVPVLVFRDKVPYHEQGLPFILVKFLYYKKSAE